MGANSMREVLSTLMFEVEMMVARIRRYTSFSVEMRGEWDGSGLPTMLRLFFFLSGIFF